MQVTHLGTLAKGSTSSPGMSLSWSKGLGKQRGVPNSGAASTQKAPWWFSTMESESLEPWMKEFHQSVQTFPKPNFLFHPKILEWWMVSWSENVPSIDGSMETLPKLPSGGFLRKPAPTSFQKREESVDFIDHLSV